jgi:Cof subfamily protein (haloacid dehalogenase superfamily)
MIHPRALPFKCSAVITDVNGTLVNDEKRLTSGAISAVAKLRACGIVFSIISSRPPRGLRPLFRPLGITTPIASFNGGVVAANDLSVITEHLLSRALARRAVDMLNAHGVQVWVFSGQDWLVRDSGALYVDIEERTLGFLAKNVQDSEASLDGVAKIVGVSSDFALLARCESDMRAALADDASVARSQPYHLDITHPLANKRAALSEIAGLLALPLAEIAVIGDGGNEIAMFEQSGLSIAMGNASPEARCAADFAADGNREEGFANAVEGFILGGVRSSKRAEATRVGDRAW